MSKVLIIGQVVFMAALGGVVVTQLRGGAHRAPPAKVEEPEAKKAEAEEKPGKSEEHHEEKAAAKEHEPAAKEHESPPKEHGAAAKLGDDPGEIARVLLAGNDRFASGHRTEFDLTAQREGSAGGQHPAAMVLGCSDSRVPPELVFDRGLGELFVVRSAGNIAEPVAVGSLEYAAEHLHPKVLVILGHDECGAVQAALSHDKMPSENLKAVVGYILPALKPLKGWGEGPDTVRMGVEANVRRQSEELLRRSSILRKAVSSNELTVLRAVYDVHTGHLRPL